MRGPEVLLLVAAIATLLTAALLLSEADYDERKRDRADAAAMRRLERQRAALRVRR